MTPIRDNFINLLGTTRNYQRMRYFVLERF